MNKKALFCVASPLQAICALEALDYYHLYDYDFVVIDEGTRTSQITNLLRDNNISYTILYYRCSSIESCLRIINAFHKSESKYDYFFLGDYRSVAYKLKFLPFVKDGGKIVYLDDGNYIIGLAKGHLKTKWISRFREDIFSYAAGRRNISINNFFTIYADFISNEKWNIEKNNFNSLNTTKTDNPAIIIVGTVTKVYCQYLGLSLDRFNKVQDRLIRDIKNKYPENRIVFVPHGRDDNALIQIKCDQFGIDYLKSEVSIEFLLLSEKIQPVEVYGFSSSALYTLHLMYPSAQIHNVFVNDCEGPGIDVYRDAIKTFASMGIDTICY